jgi:hypothetical protein
MSDSHFIILPSIDNPLLKGLQKPPRKKIIKVKKFSNKKMDSNEKMDDLNILGEFKKKLIQSKYQTKEWRKSQPWYHGGKKNECEKYQREILDDFFSMKFNDIQSKKTICSKTNYRLNTRTLELKEITNPLKNLDGFDWTENFDILIEDNLFINLKFVCEQGGAQTRTLREVAHFIRTQLRYLKSNVDTKYKFVNILDGDTSSLFMPMFKHIIDHDDYKEVLHKIFVGDMVEFLEWFTLK